MVIIYVLYQIPKALTLGGTENDKDRKNGKTHAGDNYIQSSVLEDIPDLDEDDERIGQANREGEMDNYEVYTKQMPVFFRLLQF